ncbi:MAG: methyltransferase domain-containing protein [Ignavibacteria bacterium]|nr:methyltransferase domain-containing protein [Ignavibacteria bacterium]
MDFKELTEKQKAQVAGGFDATPELVHFIPYLLQDLWTLGSSPNLIIEILRSLNLGANTTLLDLACGKGAVSVKIAADLEYKVTGIDLFEPFINEAKQKAKDNEVDGLCSFNVEDIHSAVRTHKNFDVVVLASAETLLGKIEKAITSLRSCVSKKGYIIIDGAYLKENSKIENPDYTVIKNYDETVKALTSQGDEIVKEIIVPVDETKRINDEYTELIRKRSEELAIKYPDKKVLFFNYVRKQEEECKIIEAEIVGCIWCIRKN